MWIYLIYALPMVVSGVLAVESAMSLHRYSIRAHRWLLAWSLACTFLYAGHYVYFSQPMEPTPVWDVVYSTCNLLVYPLFLIYLSEQTDALPLSQRPLALAAWLSPALLALLAIGLLHLLMTPQEIVLYTEVYLYHVPGELSGLCGLQEKVHFICKDIFALQVLLVTFTGVKKIRRYNQLIDTLYADTEEKSMRNYDTLLILLLVISLMSLVVNLIGRHIFLYDWILVFPSLLFSCLLLGIGWLGIEQQFGIKDVDLSEKEATVATTQKAEINSVIEEETSADTTSEAFTSSNETDPAEETADAAEDENNKRKGVTTEALAQRFVTLMNDEQLFLTHNLKLDDVVLRMGTNRTYLLNAIKSELGMTFSEYVNRLRIAYALRLMGKYPDLSRLEVSVRSGFNTITSFYRNLNKYSDSQ